MSKIALITGSAGLVGSEAVEFFADKGFDVVGIDNDMRSFFFGKDASTLWNRDRLKEKVKNYIHYDYDIRNLDKIREVFKEYNRDISIIIHTAAQPSHDWAAKEPLTDFSINATGTLNLLEVTRQYSPEAVFIFLSTNKVYGDLPNTLPLIEQENRWELPKDHPFYNGIDETMSIDQSTHSLFGASKAAADLLVQEYGRYFNMKTVCFRGGCLTGPYHSPARLHGFLAYLVKCCVKDEEFTILGYKGKQVRDNIHSYDLINAIYYFYENPKLGEVYNMGGGRQNSCSVLEAIKLCEKISGKKLKTKYNEQNRIGDHIWYISNLEKFKKHYPQWGQKFDLAKIFTQMYEEKLVSKL